MLALLTGRVTCACCVWPLVARSSTSSFRCEGGLSTPAAAPRHSGWRSSPRPLVDLIISRANVIDTLQGGLREDVTVLIGGGRILAVEDAAAGTDAHPGATRIDGRGKFVVPGYNDMHSHVLELDDPSGALALMLAEGVTGFRQMSGSPERLAERREGRLPIGDAAPALLETPGFVLTPLNAGSPEIAAAEVRRQKAEGADFIKVAFVSPEVLAVVLATARGVGISVLGHLQDGFDAVTAAQAGFRCIEHLGPGAPLWIACSSQEETLRKETPAVRIKAPPIHIPFLLKLIQSRIQLMLINPAAFAPPRQAERVRRAIASFDEAKFQAVAARFRAEDTWQCPTLVRLRTQELADAPDYDTHPDLKYMPPDRVKRWRKVTRRFKKLPPETRRAYADAYPHQQKLARKLASEGVRLIAGTDGGWLAAPGLTLQEEFAELAAAGFTPLEILQMATINAAEYLGREATMGRVEPGCAADLVVLDRDPRLDVAHLGAIAGVVRNGTHHSRADLDDLRQSVERGRGYLT